MDSILNSTDLFIQSFFTIMLDVVSLAYAIVGSLVGRRKEM